MLTVSIQAGGQSSRMGEDKALRPFLGRPLIERLVGRLKPVADEIIVTTNRPEEYAFLRLPLFTDLVPDRGPLGGLYTAIACAGMPLVAVVACDMPFASASLIEMSAKLMLKEDVDVVIAGSEEGFEPLHAVYRKETCLPAIEAAIQAGLWKVISWFPQVKVRILDEEELREADPHGLAFWNVNTPEEFSEAERLASTND